MQVFGFGNNWAQYSRFVGDVFGGALAAEGIFAFFLEAGFIGVMLFGWNRVGPKLHYFSTICVAFGAHFSALWIVAANSWMQTPAGYELVGEGAEMHAVLTSYWQMIFNPSFLAEIVAFAKKPLERSCFRLQCYSLSFFLSNRRFIEPYNGDYLLGVYEV